MPERPLRADARRNRQKVLDAAREAFETSGLAVPLDEIAARAGVGPGTVYRHFPTKEALFGAVVAARVEDLVADARTRLDATDPGSAFFEFLSRLGAEAAAKRTVSDALTGPSTVTAQLREQVFAVLEVLLQRAQEAGAVRPEVRTADLIALLKGLLASLQAAPGEADRDVLLTVVIDGLRAR